MVDLGGARIFLSASFPSGELGEPFRPYDPQAVAEAVTAVAQAVLAAGGRLVFGAHPTISPLVLLVAGELGRREVVEVYQSRYFEGQVPPETMDLIERRYGVLRWTDPDPSGERKPSLARMREEMLSEPLDAAIFIGGMQGVVDEYELLAQMRPDVPRVPFRAPGGAARDLPPSDDQLAAQLRSRLDSDQYPAIARQLVSTLARGGALPSSGS